ncbi:Cell division cycle protein 48-like protein, partial [Smittium mucronatum]
MEDPDLFVLPGLESPFEKLAELVYFSLHHQADFARLHVSPPRGVLIYGPPGVGKTRLVKTVAQKFNINVYSIVGSEIQSPYFGQGEKVLVQKFNQAVDDAERNSCSLIFIDELDTIAPNRDYASNHETRLVSSLLVLLDGIKSRGNVIVVGASNRPNSIDSALRRPGRLEREISINVPTRSDRKAILTYYLSRFGCRTAPAPTTTTSSTIESGTSPLSPLFNNKKYTCLTKTKFFFAHFFRKDFVEWLAGRTVGFVGADLEALCREAYIHSLTHNPDLMRPLAASDFAEAFKLVPASAKKGYTIDVSDYSWDDIGGLYETKQ